MRIFSLSKVIVSIWVLAFNQSCGGPTQKAKIASAIQTLMANTIEAFATKEEGNSTVNFNCGDGSGNQGSFTYSVPADLDDPLTLIAYLGGSGNSLASLPVTFSNCVIKTCGEELVLNGTTATLGMDVSLLLQDSASTDEVPTAFTLTLSELSTAGIASGTFTFSYVIEAIFSTGTIRSIVIKETDPVAPLTYDGHTFSASELASLSEGC